MDRQGRLALEMDTRKRIAIYGGTFDPVHLGHLQIARRVSQLFAIDQFLFVPARVAPHKSGREVSSGFHRYAMLALATRQDPKLYISTFELEAPERQYSVDTLDHFRAELGDFNDLFFVMGADSWAEITTWREWERLMTLANLIVVTRPGYNFEVLDASGAVALPANSGSKVSNSEVVDLRGLEETGFVSKSGPGEKRVFMTDAVMFDVSATAVREAARQNDEDKLNTLVPLEVANYIRKHRLYRNRNEA